MKKYYIAASIIGAVEIKADTPQQALEKAQKYLSKRFTLQVFETAEEPTPDVGSSN